MDAEREFIEELKSHGDWQRELSERISQLDEESISQLYFTVTETETPESKPILRSILTSYRYPGRASAMTLRDTIDNLVAEPGADIDQALIELLAFPHTVVVEHAAMALGNRGVTAAIDPLKQVAGLDFEAFCHLEQLNEARRNPGTHQQVTDAAKRALQQLGAPLTAAAGSSLGCILSAGSILLMLGLGVLAAVILA